METIMAAHSDRRYDLVLTKDQEAMVQILLKEAAQFGIPTTRGLILREILKKGFEIYSVVNEAERKIKK
jgi:hypothetical protein